MEYLIRNSTKNDVYKVAHVVTISWNETYKGLIPDEFLNDLKNNEDERARRALEKFENDEYKY